MEKKSIEQYVDDLLQLSGIENEGLVVRQTLHHMLMCVKLYETLDAEKRERVAKWRKHFQFLIAIRFNLKERKRRKEKKNSPSYSPNKEKPQEAKGENTTPTVCDADSGFDEDLLKRLRAFEAKCEKYVGKYGRDMIDNFVRYWTMPNQETGKMKFEEETYWSTEGRIERWMNTNYSIVNTTAAINQQRTKKRQTQEMKQTQQLQAAALARQQEEERQAQKDAESRQNRQSSTDYVNKNPNGFLAKMYRESEREKAAKAAKGPKGSA